MKRQPKPALPVRVAEVKQGIADWRANRVKRSRMPRDLWAAATELAREHGVYRISRELGIGYSSLKARVEAHGAMEGTASSSAGGFVELPASQLLASSAVAGPVVELSDSDGFRLTVRLPQGEQLDVLSLLKTLWRQHT